MLNVKINIIYTIIILDLFYEFSSLFFSLFDFVIPPSNITSLYHHHKEANSTCKRGQ